MLNLDAILSFQHQFRRLLGCYAGNVTLDKNQLKYFCFMLTRLLGFDFERLCFSKCSLKLVQVASLCANYSVRTVYCELSHKQTTFKLELGICH